MDLLRLIRIGLVTAMLALIGCDKEEPILQGKREPVTAGLHANESTDAQAPVRGSAPINLPKATPNRDWSQSIGTQAYRATHPALSAQPQLIWSTDIGLGDSRKQRITADPVASQGQIYTLDADSQVSALNEAGEILWQRSIRPARDNAGEATGGGLAVDGETLYVTSGYGAVIALDTNSGDERWRQRLDATGSGAPTVYGDLLYLTAGDTQGWAINKTTGRIAWQITSDEDVSNVLGAPAPAVTERLAVFAFGSGEIQAVLRRGGLRRWVTFVTEDRPSWALGTVDDVTGDPVIAGDTVYVGNQAAGMLAIDAHTGALNWSVPDGAVDRMYPIANSVFALSVRNKLLRLDAASGDVIWQVSLPNFINGRPRRAAAVFAHHGPIVAGSLVWIASSDAQLRGYDPVDGALKQAIEIPGGGATTGPVVAGETLYLVSRDGRLLAYR